MGWGASAFLATKHTLRYGAKQKGAGFAAHFVRRTEIRHGVDSYYFRAKPIIKSINVEAITARYNSKISSGLLRVSAIKTTAIQISRMVAKIEA
jgi:hypothetical protein